MQDATICSPMYPGSASLDVSVCCHTLHRLAAWIGRRSVGCSRLRPSSASNTERKPDRDCATAAFASYFLMNTARSVRASSPPISPTVPVPMNLRTVSLNLNPQIPKPWRRKISTDAASNPPNARKRNLTILFLEMEGVIGGSLRHPVLYRDSNQRERARWAHGGGARASSARAIR